MGANFQSTTLDIKLTEKEVSEKFSQLSEGAAYSHGHEYSGSWNMLDRVTFPTTQVFESLNAADKYATDKAEKWDNAVAVRFKEVRKVFILRPTFGGEQVDNSLAYKIIYFKIDWKARNGYRQMQAGTPIASDQLTAEEKAQAVKLFDTARKLGHEYKAASHRWPECGYASVTDDEIRKKYKEYETAEKAFDAFAKPISERILATKDEPYEAWFMGGWCAE